MRWDEADAREQRASGTSLKAEAGRAEALEWLGARTGNRGVLVTVSLSFEGPGPLLARLAVPLALKVVEQALGRVAQLVALVVDVVPAGQWGGAVGPGVLHGEGTVTPVPLAGVAVAGLIADAVPSFVGTILAVTGGRWGAGGGCVELAAAAPERWRALAGVIRGLALREAASSVLAGAAGTAQLALLGVRAEAAGP